MTKRTKKQHGFSLIEVAVVILIIGLLVTGTLKGTRLLNLNKLHSAQGLTLSSPVANISGLALWFETSMEDSFVSSEATDGGQLTTWNDRNPQASIKFTATTSASSAITYKQFSDINNLPSVYFDGTSTATFTLQDVSGSVPLYTPSNAFTFFVVSKLDSDATGVRKVFANGNGTGWGYGVSNSYHRIGFPGGTDDDSSSASVTSTPTIIAATHTGGTSGDITLYVNGTNEGLTASTTTVVTPTTAFYIGNKSSGNAWKGYISEIIVFNRALSKTERKSVEKYLGQKYNIQVNDSSTDCTISITGVDSTTLSDGSSSSYSCSQTGYTGSTASYTCNSGTLSPTPSSTACACATDYSSSGGACVLSIPSNSVAPALTSNSPTVGTSISTSTGTWSPTPTSYTYQWWWADTPAAISEATSSSYTPVSGDVGHTLLCKVAATNASGTSAAVSSNTTTNAIPTSIPSNSVAPALSSDSPTVGTSISTTTGTWSPTPTSYAYQWWWADGTPASISGATSSSYTPVSGDAGHTLLCKVTATNSGGTSAAVSSNTTTNAIPSIPSNSVAPALSSNSPTVGTSISTTTGTWSPTPTSYAYQWWWADGTPAAISGATSSSYTPVSGDAGHTLLCKVSATNTTGTSSAVSSNTTTSSVPSIPSNSVAPALSSTSPAVGTSLSVTTGTWSPTPTSYSYQWWWADGTPAAISGATSSSYTPVSGDTGHTLLCKVTATNTTGTSSAVSSNTSSAVTNNALNCTAGGNTISTSGGMKYHIFTSSGNLTCNGGSTTNFNIFVVGGGGGGGAGVLSSGPGGGGGGGQVKESLAQTVSSLSSATITIGSAGSTNGGSGGSSIFSSTPLSVTAKGGIGGGARSASAPSNDDTTNRPGGGVGAPSSTGASVSNGSGTQQGGKGYYNGSSGRGGGGGSTANAGGNATSTNSGSGGEGSSSSVTGASGKYGCGGSGGGVAVAAGTCASGYGTGASGSTAATSGAANRGCGGGGGGGGSATGAAGSNGIIILSYPE